MTARQTASTVHVTDLTPPLGVEATVPLSDLARVEHRAVVAAAHLALPGKEARGKRKSSSSSRSRRRRRRRGDRRRGGRAPRSGNHGARLEELEAILRKVQTDPAWLESPGRTRD
jgi:hypothetical protein